MSKGIARRDALKQLTLAGAGVAFSGGIIRGRSAAIVVNGRPVEIVVASVSPTTVRISVVPIDGGAIPDHNALVSAAAGKQAARRREAFQSIRAGDLTVSFAPDPPALTITDGRGQPVQ